MTFLIFFFLFASDALKRLLPKTVLWIRNTRTYWPRELCSVPFTTFHHHRWLSVHDCVGVLSCCGFLATRHVILSHLCGGGWCLKMFLKSRGLGRCQKTLCSRRNLILTNTQFQPSQGHSHLPSVWITFPGPERLKLHVLRNSEPFSYVCEVVLSTRENPLLAMSRQYVHGRDSPWSRND